MTGLIARDNPLQPDVQGLLQEGLAFMRTQFSEDECFVLAPHELTASNTYLWTYRDDGRVVGCIALVSHGDWAEIKRMFIREHYRQRGLGRQLIDTAINHARLDGIKSVRLETAAKLNDAVRLYRRLGFRDIPAFADYVSSPSSLCMERTIN